VPLSSEASVVSLTASLSLYCLLAATVAVHLVVEEEEKREDWEKK
jgi:hypothetical protein